MRDSIDQSTRRAAGAAVAALIAAGMLSSCSSSDDNSTASATLAPTVTAPSTPTGPVITDSGALQAALLTGPDLPAGFTPAAEAAPPLQQPGPTQAPPPDKSHTDPAECATVLAPLSDQRKDSAAHAITRYDGPDFSSIDIDAASYPGTGAAQLFSDIQSQLAHCLHYSGTDADGVSVDYRLSGLDQAKVGDASTALRLKTSSEGFTLTSGVVIAVVGSTVMQLNATGQQPIDPKVLSALATKQADKLRGASGA